MRRRHVLLPLVALALGVCAPALTAVRAENGAWGGVVIPGGASGVRQVAFLGSPDRPVANLLADLARRLNSTPVGLRRDPTETLVRYFTFLETLGRSLDRLPDGLRLSLARDADRDTRNAFRDAIELMGLRVETRNDVLSVVPATDDASVERSRWLQGVGVSTADIAAQLNGGDVVRPAWRDDTVPLPLPALWQQLVFRNGRSPIGSLAGSAQSLRFYLGLVSLDEGTRAWLAERPDLFKRLHDDLALPFSVFGRSLRVVDGRVDPPGGEPVRAIWETLVDAPASRPEEFIRKVLEKDDGRLAYFYDLVAHLDAGRRGFLLGDHLAAAAPRDRIRFVRRVFDRVKAFDSTWDATRLPYFRPAVDPALVVSAIEVNADGEIGPRWWPALLEHVASDDSWPDRIRPLRLQERPGDADWLLGWVFESTEKATTRYLTLRFLQRRFAGAPAEAAPEMAIALRTRVDMPALALSLERLGLSSPATFAAIALASRRLTENGDPSDVSSAMRVWQGSLALVEQVSRHRGLPVETADAIVGSLSALELERPARPEGAVVGWILRDALPRLGVSGPREGEPFEVGAVRSMLRRDPAGDVNLLWEGLPYRIDPAGPATEAALRIRQLTPGPRLDDLVTLLRVARLLSTPIETIEALAPLVADLQAVHPALESVRSHDGEPRAFNRLRDVIRNLERISRPRDLNRAARETRHLLEVLDETAADVIPALAYALAVVPTANPPQIYSDAHRLHDYGVGSLDRNFRTLAWEMPRVANREGGGTHLSGAMLGIDVARASEQLRRAVSDAPRRPVVSEPDYTASAQRVVLRPATSGWAGRGGVVASAVARGREIVAGWQAGGVVPSEIEARLRDARLSEWRVSMAVALAAGGTRDGFDGYFTITDFYRLGSTEDPAETWGQSGWFIEGCWCLRRLDRRPPEDWLGRTLGLSASVTGDLPLRLTELLAELDLPHDLLEPLLPMAVQDLLDHVDQAANDDWESLAWPKRLTRDRVETYLLQLVSEGHLAKPRAGDGRERRP